MATSGQLNTNTAYDSYFWVKWSQSGTQSVADNSTTINWSCGVYCGHNFYSNAIKMSAVTINGVQVYSGGTYSNFYTGNHTIASGSLKISHGSDGTKTFSISSFTGWLYSNNNYSSAGGSFELERIARLSVPTVSSNSVDFGSKVTIYTNRQSSVFMHKLFYKYGTSGWVAITTEASVGTSYEWTVPYDLMYQIPNNDSLDITISCDTYYNGSYIGEEHVSIKATVPATVLPEIEDIEWVKSSTEPSTWPITQHVSTGTMNVYAQGLYGASITAHSLTFAGLSSTAATLAVTNIASSGKLKAVAKVTDSRGRSATKEVEFTVAAYSKPQLSVSAFRSDASGVEDPGGDYLCVNATAGVTAVGDNAVQSVTLQYKQRSASTYTSVALTPGTSKVVAASSNNTWDWIVSAADKVNTVSANGSIATGDVVLDILANGQGIGLGKVAEKEGLDSAWPFALNGVPQVDYIIEQKTTGIWTYRKWASGIAECWGLYSVDNWDISTAWGYIFESKEAIATQLPSGLFVDVPVFNMNVQHSSAGILSLETVSNVNKDMTCYIYPTRATPGVVSIVIAMRAVGKWKQ